VIAVETLKVPCRDLATNVQLMMRLHGVDVLLYTIFPAKSDLKIDKAALRLRGIVIEECAVRRYRFKGRRGMKPSWAAIILPTSLLLVRAMGVTMLATCV
jgi:hypothetical protein